MATIQMQKKDAAQSAPSTKYAKVDCAVDNVLPYTPAKHMTDSTESEMESSKIGNTWSTRSIVTSSPPGTPLSCSTFNTTATTPISDSFPDSTGMPGMPIVMVQGMPFNMERVMEMGQALTQARREKQFPPTTTPTYNIQAVIDDYEDLQRLNAAREGSTNARDDAFRPEVARLYVGIQRRIQDRDLTHGEVAADSNVRARLSGLANGTGAETAIYNLMRHAVNSVLRHNNLTVDSDSNIVEATAARVVGDIRATVQGQVARGTHGVDGVNMGNVMEDVFNAIEGALRQEVAALSQEVGAQANRLDGQINNMGGITNNMSSITNAQNAQVDAIAGHVKAIDSHVHAMGNNVNAMGSLVNSTNGNLTALTGNVGTLQALLNMLPQMVANAVREMIPDIIGPAVEQAFAAAISNELVARLQAFTHAAQAAQARGNKRTNWFSKLNIFKKRSGRRH